MSNLLEKEGVSNVYIYVGDAVRWDYFKDCKESTIFSSNEWSTSKAIAASIHTPSSFASILTGKHLPETGVTDFTTPLAEETPTLLDQVDFNTTFINSIDNMFNNSTGLISETLGIDSETQESLSNIDPPFICVERGPGGHAPYGSQTGSAWEYFEATSNYTKEEFEDEYSCALLKDFEWFETRLKTLQDRDLLNDTLVIYTSDHGELLGESGSLGHNAPIHPHLAYIPLAVRHPKTKFSAPQGRPISHVDLYPTINSICNSKDRPESNFGYDLTTEQPSTRRFCSFTKSYFDFPLVNGKLDIDSIWGVNGGYILQQNSRRERLSVLLGKLLKSPKRHFLRKKSGSNLRSYMRNSKKFGSPEFDIETALQDIEKIYKYSSRANKADSIEINKERLEDLGYLS